ncbi:MAG: hypothetical protein M3P48_11300 [Actinomycetota bacterium]|nr:hypothetical protein [Actinomycetota bacterium]
MSEGGDTTASCGECGAVRPDMPLTWTRSLERDRWRWYCEVCTREHARSIEGRLDQEWWA